jgi:hypothetical protein
VMIVGMMSTRRTFILNLGEKQTPSVG